MADLYIPIEILHLIASCHVHAYRALLAIPMFARSVICNGKNYMNMFGYRVDIMDDGFEYWYCDDELYYIKTAPNIMNAKYYLELEDAGQVVVDFPNVGRFWYHGGLLHRALDGCGDIGPAVERTDGTKEWWWMGKRHRFSDRYIYHNDNQNVEPAIIRADGSKEWYWNGVLHRDHDSPAIIRADGTKDWYRLGKRHRSNDHNQDVGPAIEYPNGGKEWYWAGKLHRCPDVNSGFVGPAVESSNGNHEWWSMGKRHRDGGFPAIVQAGGFKEWWMNGKLLKSTNTV
jgi:hypothetical protein